MPTNEIAELPIKDIADKDCILFMWVIFPKLDEFMEIVNAWGFEYKTVGFVWIKKNPDDYSNFFGLGAYTRANAEICIIAKKGKPKVINHSISQIIESKIGEHSRKPDIVRKKIVKLYGDLPRIELFARQKIEGWDCWGNQIPKEEQRLLK